MTSEAGNDERLGPLMDEFLSRRRDGELPSLSEFVSRHPDLEDDIRELFPAVAILAQAESVSGSSTGTPLSEHGQVLTKLGEYRIIREIGRGGMGVVYEAIQESLGRHVAVKILPWQSTQDPVHLARFDREARIAAALHHTNIVPVFAVGKLEGTHFFAMQFIRGQSLDVVLSELRRMQNGGTATGPRSHGEHGVRPVEPRSESRESSEANAVCSRELALELLSRPRQNSPPNSTASGGNSESTERPMSEPSGTSDAPSLAKSEQHLFRRIATIGVQVADALEYAHGQGVLHRDVKPSNLILDTQGTVWLTDFGLARTSASGLSSGDDPTERADDLTRTGDLVGTLRYMAPERFSGQADERGDVYGLGLTLYELLTRRSAFHSTDRIQLINDITNSRPTDPRRLVPGIPHDLETVVLKSVASSPAARYATAAEFSEDLRRFLNGEPIVARRTPPHEKFLLWCRRNRLVAALTCAVITLLVTIAATSLVSGYRLSERHNRVLENLERAQSAESDLRRSNALANRHLFQSYAAQARAERSGFRPGRRFNSLKAVRAAATLLAQLEHSEADRLMLRNEAIAAMALDDIRVRSERPLSGVVSIDRTLEFDEELSRCVSYTSSGEVDVIRTDDGKVLNRLSGCWATEDVLPTVKFGCDDRFLAICGLTRSGENRLVVLDLTTSKECFVHLFDRDPGSVTSLCFLPDGSGIVTAIGRDLVVFDLPSGREQRRWPLSDSPAFVKVSADGQWVASEHQGLVSLIPMKGTGVVHSIPNTYGTNDVAWSPDGRFLSSACQDKNIYTWDLQLRTIHAASRGHSSAVTNVAFSPSGDVLMSTSLDATTRLWQPLLGPEILRTEQRAARFSSDGHSIGFGQPGNTVGRWDVAGGDYCRTFCINVWDDDISDEVEDISFHPSGELIAITSDYGISTFSWPDGKLIQEMKPEGETAAAQFAADGASLVVCSEAGIEMWMRSITSPDLRPTYEESGEVAAHAPETKKIQLAVDGERRQFVIGDRQGRFHRLDAGDALFGPVIPLHTNAAHDRCSLSPDGKFAVFCGTSCDLVTVRDPLSGREIASLHLPSKGALATFNPESTQLAISLSESIWIVGTQNWQVQNRLQLSATSIGRVCYSPNGRMMAVQLPDSVQLRSTGDLRVLAEFTAPYGERFCTFDADQAAAIGFSGDSRMLANGTRLGTVHVWDLDAIRLALDGLNLNWSDDRSVDFKTKQQERSNQKN